VVAVGVCDVGADDESLDLGQPLRAEVLQPVAVLFDPRVPRRAVLAAFALLTLIVASVGLVVGGCGTA
jgi:hypothetical protein